MKFLKFIPIVFILFSSCKKENMCDCIKRTGKISTVTREVPAFTRLFVEQDVNVFITQDSISEVKIEAGKNIEPLIETVVENGILIIRNHNRCNWARSYKEPLNVYIKSPGLTFIHSNGSGDIKSLNTITLDSFDVQLEGSGNIELTINNSQIISHMYGIGDLTLHGTTAEHDCSIGGASFLYASDLNTSYTWIQSYTLGQCYVKASGLIIYRIDDKGDIFCYGNPSSVQKTSSVGSGQFHLQ